MNRDARLDAWRGLCLVDVVLVHLAFNGIGFPGGFDAAVRDYTRFAAGGFVLLAGLTVAAVFGPPVERSPETRRAVYGRLWRRAAWLLLASIAIEAAYRLLDELRAFPVDRETPLREALLGIAGLRAPGVLGGILVLYTLLLAASPLLLEMRRRLGDVPIALLSALLYGTTLPFSESLLWPPGRFPVAHWQALFVAGFLAARAYPAICASGRRIATWAVASSGLFALVFLLQHGPRLGIESPAAWLPLDFTKTPLRPGALLWYLAAVNLVLALSALAWRRAEGGRLARGLALLGRNSLLVYGAHVFTEAAVLELAWRWTPPAWITVALAALDVALLAALCLVAERLEVRWARRAVVAWPRAIQAAATVAIVLAIASMSVAPRVPVPSQSTPAAFDAEASLIAEHALGDPRPDATEALAVEYDGGYSSTDLLDATGDGLPPGEEPQATEPDPA